MKHTVAASDWIAVMKQRTWDIIDHSTVESLKSDTILAM
jgi:hypothetical protein